MDNDQSVDTYKVRSKHSLDTWARVYLHGLIAFVLIFAIAYLVTLLLPVFDFTGNRLLSIVVTVFAILVGPPMVGSVILFGVFPLLGKKEALRGLLRWDDRLLNEISDAKEKAQIVMINWPSEEVRTMGVLTSSFLSPEGATQLAAVYVPTTPQTKLGYIRVVKLDQVEFTDWTLKQWQLYQFTFGSVCPDRIREVDDLH
ncbi:hypothetical protein CA13_66120 [Planctomycetes bacterium CA13]|uniref:Uncharacterized protein n=1 Tax=Novipirellula herctigrandis TaxID=2527986 RepID=A0A5C5ZD94_9BACT|nr:hypothetical protein CA13_66120 [Planctomycetes bacterium CA13]